MSNNRWNRNYTQSQSLGKSAYQVEQERRAKINKEKLKRLQERLENNSDE